MTPSQLRQWSFQNSQPDQWWLCLDGVTEEVPVTIAEIESLLASGDYSQAQALHTSHAEIVNPAWIYLTVPATVATPPSVDSALAALAAKNRSLPPLTDDPHTTTIQFPASQSVEDGAKITPEGVMWAWIFGGVFALLILYMIYLFASLALLFVAGSTFFLILGGVVWKRLLPKTPDVVLLIASLAAIAGLCYAGFKILLTTDLFDGKSLASIIHPSESREVPKTGATVSGEYTITGDNFTGFSRLEDEERATELASDTEAFGKFFTAGAMSNRATLFKRGETVILEESEGLLSGKVKLRRKGEAVSYWTNREAID